MKIWKIYVERFGYSQYFSKAHDFSAIADAEVRRVMDQA
jgi:hypothetical protein